MTVSSTTALQQYTSNGVSDEYVISFPFLALASNIAVYNITNGYSLKTKYVQGTDYNVIGLPSSPKVKWLSGKIPADQTVFEIRREIALTQEADYISTGAFRPETHEAALDRIVMMLQDISAKLAVGDIGLSDFMKIGSSGQYDAKGLRIVNGAAPVDPEDFARLVDVDAAVSGGAVAEMAGFSVQRFTSTGGTEFQTSFQAITATDVMVFVGVAYQDPDESTGAYTVDNSLNPLSGSKIVFGTAVPSGQIVFVIGPRGTVVSSPASISITDANVAANALSATRITAGSDNHALISLSGANAMRAITSAMISDLAATLSSRTLNSFTAPTGNVAFGGHRATGLANGTAGSDAATVTQLAERRRTFAQTKSTTGTTVKSASFSCPFEVCFVGVAASNAYGAEFTFRGGSESRIRVTENVSGAKFKTTCTKTNPGEILVEIEGLSGSPALPASIDFIAIEGND